MCCRHRRVRVQSLQSDGPSESALFNSCSRGRVAGSLGEHFETSLTSLVPKNQMCLQLRHITTWVPGHSHESVWCSSGVLG